MSTHQGQNPAVGAAQGDDNKLVAAAMASSSQKQDSPSILSQALTQNWTTDVIQDAGLTTIEEAVPAPETKNSTSNFAAEITTTIIIPALLPRGEGSHWVVCWDPAFAAEYYYDFYTGEWTWERPEGQQLTTAANDRVMAMVIQMQCAYRNKKARVELQRRLRPCPFSPVWVSLMKTWSEHHKTRTECIGRLCIHKDHLPSLGETLTQEFDLPPVSRLGAKPMSKLEQTALGSYRVKMDLQLRELSAKEAPVLKLETQEFLFVRIVRGSKMRTQRPRLRLLLECDKYRAEKTSSAGRKVIGSDGEENVEWNEALKLEIPSNWQTAKRMRLSFEVLDEEGKTTCQTLSLASLQPTMSWVSLYNFLPDAPEDAWMDSGSHLLFSLQVIVFAPSHACTHVPHSTTVSSTLVFFKFAQALHCLYIKRL
jgi:hypothetical protein